MDYMIFAVFFIVQIMQKACSQDCILDRNDQNKYPFIVKIVKGSEIRAHGTLVTPQRVMSPLQPLKDFKTAGREFEFIVQVLEGGALKCSITRKLGSIKPMVIPTVPEPYLVLWKMKTGFPATLNHPFLFPDLEDMTFARLNENLKNAKDGDICELVAFKSKDAKETKLNVDQKIEYISRPTAQSRGWDTLACNGDSLCLKDSIYAIDLANRLAERWYEGAVMVCRGKPLGILTKMLEDAKKLKIMRLESLDFATMFYNWAAAEWPKPNPPPKQPPAADPDDTTTTPAPDPDDTTEAPGAIPTMTMTTSEAVDENPTPDTPSNTSVTTSTNSTEAMLKLPTVPLSSADPNPHNSIKIISPILIIISKV